MENSKYLLEYVIETLNIGNIPEDKWSIGGGTVLAAVYNHRLSKDIDVFIEDVQFLTELSPRFNGKSEEALDYQEMSQFISLTYKEGKVDFIASPTITKFEAVKKNFFGRAVRLDDPIEIVSKKIYFRGNQVLARDIFDLATVYDSNRKSDLIDVMLSMPEKFKVFKENFAEKIKQPEFVPYSKEHEDMLLNGGKRLFGKEIAICSDFISSVERMENKKLCAREKVRARKSNFIVKT